MLVRRNIALVAAIAALVAGVAPSASDAAPKKKTSNSAHKKSVKPSKGAKGGKDADARRHINDKGSMKVCTTKGSGKRAKKSCHRVAIFQGHGIPSSELRSLPLDTPSGHLWIYAENLDEEVKVDLYDGDGRMDETVLAQLDELFRCKRTNEIRAMRPEIYEMVSRIQDHFAGKRIELVSGFRFAERNSSRHYHASATDLRVRDVSTRELYDFAQTLDMGGMGIGIYPNEGFIHLDFRAPGEPSYRWTDLSGAPGSGHKKKGKGGRGGKTKSHKPVG